MFWLLLACIDPAHTTRAAGPGPHAVADPDTAGDSGDTGHPDTADSGARDTADTAVHDTAPVDSGPVYPAPCNAWGVPRDMGTLLDPELDEVSSVEPSTLNPGVLWVLEDHAGAPAVYAIDYAGNLLGTLTLDGVENTDWESMALGACEPGVDESSCLWVGDTGDNEGIRPSMSIFRVPEPVVGFAGGFVGDETPTQFPFTYPSGPANTEAMALTPDGHPVLVTKRTDGTGEVYVLDTLVPDMPGVARLIGSIATRDADQDYGGLATSADLWPDGSRLLLRTYDHAWEYELGDAGVEGIVTAPRIALPFSDVVHVESVAYDTVERGYWQIPEGAAAPIAFTPCAD